MSVPGPGLIDSISSRWRKALNLPSTPNVRGGGVPGLPSSFSGGSSLPSLPSNISGPRTGGLSLPSTYGAKQTASLGVASLPSIRSAWMQQNVASDAGDQFGRGNIGDPSNYDSGVAPRGLDGTKQWDQQIKQAAEEAGIPWQVVAAIMGIESQGQSGLTSVAGAVGLMQIMPNIWGGLAEQYGGDLHNPWTNIRTGAQILRTLYDQYGSWDKAAAAYLGAIDQNGNITNDPDAYGTDGFAYVNIFRANLHALGYGNPSQGEYDSGGQPATPMAATMLDFAMNAQGTQYVWGGADLNGFDCSGLVFAALSQIGINIGRTAQQQYNNTAQVDYTQVQPGDLVFFHYGSTDPRQDPNEYINHVAIYIGNGQIVHATSNGGQVIVSSLSEPWLAQNIVGYGRAY